MDQLVIEAKNRTESGKAAVRRLRGTGRIPAVMYDEAGKAVSLDVDAVQFNKVWRGITSTQLVTLDVEGKKYDAFIRDTNYDIKTDEVLHADFFAVSNTKKVTRTYKVQYSGTAAGVLKGGFMVKHLPEVKVKCLPKDLPVRLVIDVSGINIGDIYRVKDLNLGESVEILTPMESSLISVAPAR